MANTLQANQIADAIVAAPGVTVEAVRYLPAGNRDIDSGDTAFKTLGTDEADEAEAEFVVPFTGTYRVKLVGSGFGVSASAATGFEFQCLFDEAGFGGWAETAVGDNWKQWYQTDGEFLQWVFEGQTIELEAGTHKVAIQAKFLSGTMTFRANTNTIQAVYLEYASGSGAGGELVSVRSMDQNDALTTTAAWEAIQDSGGDFSFTVNTTATDWVTVEGKFQYTVGSAGTVRFGLGVDGADPVDDLSNAIRTEVIGGNNVAYPIFKVQPGAGQHVLRLYGYQDASVTYTVRGGVTDAATLMWATITRGGQVPIQQNSVTVTSTPTAFDFVGDNVSVTNVGGKAQVEVLGFTPVVESEPFFAALAGGATAPSLFGGSFTLGGEFCVTQEGAKILGAYFYSPTASAKTWRIKLWEAGNSTALKSKDIAVSSIGLVECRFDTPYLVDDADVPEKKFIISLWDTSGSQYATRDPSSYEAGPHVYDAHTALMRPRIYASGDALPVTLHASASYSIDPIVSAAINEAGFVKPENVPILEYSSASVVNVVPAPGAGTQLRVLLNDGIRYTASASLSVDLSASGLGGLDTGSEASDTWYYLYTVPGVAEGTLAAVASVSDPDTGPTGYSIWRYLGAIRNDASSDIANFLQVGPADFRYVEPSQVSSLSATAKTSYDASAYCPATAATMKVLVRADYSTALAAHIVFATGATNRIAFTIADTGISPGTVPADLPIGGSPRGWDYQINTGITGGYYFQGWTDAYLSGDRESRAPAFNPDTLWRYPTVSDVPTGSIAPEAVWNFDGTGSSLNDRTANGHDGTAEGGSVRYTASEGLVGLASDDTFRLLLASPAALRTTGAATIEVLVAVNIDDTTQSVFFYGGVTASEAEADNVLFNLYSSTGRVLGSFYEYGAGTNESILFDASPIYGPVHHLVFTRSSDGLTHKVYIDGQLLDTKVVSNAPSGGGNTVFYLMGGESGGYQNFFHGAMFGGRMFKTEWSAAQVLEAYQFCRRIG